MSSSVDELKAKGNEALKNGLFNEAIEFYSQAIEIDPKNRALYSNRSAAHASRKDYGSALYDAENTIKVSPDWFKGYSRKATALSYQGKYDLAIQAIKDGLEKNPGNESLIDMEAEIHSLMGQSAPQQGSPQMDIANMFNEETMWKKLGEHPKTSLLLADSDFCTKMKAIQANPEQLSQFVNDEKVMLGLSVLLGIADLTEDMGHAREDEKKKVEEEKERQERMSGNERTSLEEKDMGNKAYKEKKFVEAISHYEKAIELDPTNYSFYLNKAAALLENKDYDGCTKQCEEVIAKAKAENADPQIIAKAWGRLASAYERQGMIQEALTACNKSLVEHRLPNVIALSRNLEKLDAEAKRKAYIDPEKSLEVKNEGNEEFKKGHYPEAIKLYTEAIKRNPEDPVLYSNRAACYMKMCEWDFGISDCNKCLELDPKFFKGFTRKAAIFFFQKDYNRALEVYDEALKVYPEHPELIEGIQKTLHSANTASSTSGRQPEETDEEVLQRAARDPEVSEILSDPVMNQILRDMQNDPSAAAEHMRNPIIQKKVEKLVKAGVIRVSR